MNTLVQYTIFMKATFKNIGVALCLLAMVMAVLLAVDKASDVAAINTKTYIKVTVVDENGIPVHNAQITVNGQSFFTDNKGVSPAIELTELTNCYDENIAAWRTTTVIAQKDGYVPSIVFNCVVYDAQTRKLTVKIYQKDSSELPCVTYVESPPEDYVKSLLKKN